MGESTKNLPDDYLGNNPFIRGEQYEVTVDTDGVASIQTDFTPRGALVLESDVFCEVSVAYTRNGIAKLRFTRLWEFLERHHRLSDVAYFDFEVALDAYDDYELRILGYWEGGPATEPLIWRINEADTDSLSSCHSKVGEVRGMTSAGYDGLVAAMGEGTGANVRLRSELGIVPGKTKLLLSENATSDTGFDADTNRYTVGGKFVAEGEYDRVRSVGLACYATGEGTTPYILTDSHFDLYRKSQFNKTKIKIWVY